MKMMKKVLSALLALAFALVPNLAWAHSALVLTNPAPNSQVDAGPRLVKLGFNLPLLKIDSTYQSEIVIKDPAGQVLKPVCSGAAATAIFGVYEFTKVGQYSLAWRAVSDDGHVIGSAYNFKVLDGSTAVENSADLCKENGLAVGTLKEPSTQVPASSNVGYELPPGFVFWVIGGVLVMTVYYIRREKAERP
jgi:methionine-rich copper-binding protein CopC